MPSHLDRASLEGEVRELDCRDGHPWCVQLGEGLRVYVTFSPAESQDVYCIRLDFGERIADGPPSVTFCDPETHAEAQLRAWPRGLDEYFKPPPNNGPVGWICNPWTREGRQNHPEWGSRGWRPTRVVWRVTSAILDILDRQGRYQGRAV
jgi:hypothetical protein